LPDRSGVNEQPLDLKGAFRAIWLHKLLVALVMAVGLAAGLAYAVKKPPEPVARALVLLPSSDVSPTGGASPYTQTEVIIATSTPVLSAAGASVQPPVPAAELRSELKVTAESQNVLQVEVSAANGTEALRLANAVATNYIAFSTKAAAGTSALVAALQQQSSKLTKEILNFQYQINAVSARIRSESPGSSAGQRDAAFLTALQAEQQSVAAELNNVNSDVVNAEISGAQAASATEVLQPAELVPSSKTTSRVTDGLIGALAGLAAGCLSAMARTRGDRRLRPRDAIAAALGVPVVASLNARPCRTTSEWRQLLERHRPTPTELWNARRVLHRVPHLDGPGRSQLNVLTFAGDTAAAAAAVKLAEDASALGMNVQLTVGQQQSLASLRAACLAGQRASSPAHMAAGENGDRSPSADLGGGHLELTLTTLDQKRPEVAIASGTSGTTLLAVSAGFATAEALARAALASVDEKAPIEGVLLVNPDPLDTTTGMVPQAREPLPFAQRGAHRASASLSGGALR
jgi:capsular polysaccharide biosynthesis protein